MLGNSCNLVLRLLLRVWSVPKFCMHRLRTVVFTITFYSIMSMSMSSSSGRCLVNGALLLFRRVSMVKNLSTTMGQSLTMFSYRSVR